MPLPDAEAASDGAGRLDPIDDCSAEREWLAEAEALAGAWLWVKPPEADLSPKVPSSEVLADGEPLAVHSTLSVGAAAAPYWLPVLLRVGASSASAALLTVPLAVGSDVGEPATLESEAAALKEPDPVVVGELVALPEAEVEPGTLAVLVPAVEAPNTGSLLASTLLEAAPEAVPEASAMAKAVAVSEVFAEAVVAPAEGLAETAALLK